MGRDISPRHCTAVITVFQSARPRGARRWRPDSMPRFFQFQSARPRGARRGVVVNVSSWRYVSIRAPAWGATILNDQPITNFGVSIRAPAWGATGPAVKAFRRGDVSIRAPAWGATAPLSTACAFVKGFQSARPRGARRLCTAAWMRELGVSIRAPAWGATSIPWVNGLLPAFQSARPRGARHY